MTAGGRELGARSSPACSFYLAANFSDLTSKARNRSLRPGRCLTFRAPPAALFNRRLQVERNRRGRARMLSTAFRMSVPAEVVGGGADEFLRQVGDSEFRFSVGGAELPVSRSICAGSDFTLQASPSNTRLPISQPARFNDANHDQLQRRQCFPACRGCFTWKVVAEVKSQDGKENILTCILTL